MIIGTAGHVDHGKTTLIRALTGEDTDRLPEEKRRGISIDLGFARFVLPSGREAGVVDVPGHERFIRNMVAGVVGMDLVLLVVAADEGVMPQTREHLDILDLLGVQAGIVVITKKDLVEPEWLDLVRDEVRQALRGTFLADAPMVAVSSVTGEGLEELKQAIDRMVPAVRPRDEEGFTRLPVDRVFTVAGFGTVVTGTLLSGTVAPEDRLEILPARREVRVRQVQVHGRAVARATAGQRVALNLVGVERGEVERGDVLATPGSLAPAATFAARLRLLSSAPRPLRNEERVRLHVGTAEVLGRVLLLDREELQPGETAFMQFKAEQPVTVARGDRYIIRTYSPMVTVGGGEVAEAGRRFKRYNPAGLAELETLAVGDRTAVLLHVLGQGLPLTAEEVARRVGAPWPALAPEVASLATAGRIVLLGGELLMSAASYGEMAERVQAFLADFHSRHPLRRGAPREVLRAALWPGLGVKAANALLERLEADGLVRLEQDVAALPGRLPELGAAEAAARDALEAAYRQGWLAPPEQEEALQMVQGSVGPETAREIFNLLVERGVLVKVDGGLYFHREALDAAMAAVRARLLEKGSMTMAEMRDLLGTTRKYAVPLGEYFDRIRLTRRVGDERCLAQRVP